MMSVLSTTSRRVNSTWAHGWWHKTDHHLLIQYAQTSTQLQIPLIEAFLPRRYSRNSSWRRWVPSEEPSSGKAFFGPIWKGRGFRQRTGPACARPVWQEVCGRSRPDMSAPFTDAGLPVALCHECASFWWLFMMGQKPGPTAWAAGPLQSYIPSPNTDCYHAIREV